MDCEQVFMILTRGPFPTGEPTDEEVEEHLETCADCWRLAEALRPALEVFQEAVPPAESRDLPGYWGDARPAATLMAQRTDVTARLASTVGVRQVVRPYYGPPRESLDSRQSGDVLRAIVMASALTATAIGLILWLFG